MNPVERDLLAALEHTERQIVALYRAAVPLGNDGDENRFADIDPAVIEARSAINRAREVLAREDGL